MTELSAESLSRRDRARVDTAREIKETARRVLVEQGADGLALRAVAREMGLTAPALYRYFSSREDLVENVVADIYGELCDLLESVRDAAEPATTGVRLMAVSRAFRTWATTHHAEFGLLFGSAGERVLPEDFRDDCERPSQLAAARFGGVFAALVAQIYLEQGFPVPTTSSPRRSGISCKRGARSSRSRCRSASSPSSFPAGSGCTGWSAWRCSGI